MELFYVKANSLVYFFVVFLLWVTDAAVPTNILAGHSELLQKLTSYEIVKPYRREGQIKRSASTRSNNGHVEETTLVIDGNKRHFTLDIFLNKGLFSPHYNEKRVLLDGTKVETQIPHKHCFYQGNVRGHNSSFVSLSTCDGIEGIITTDEGLFFIHPLKSKEGNVLEEHLVFSSNDLNEKPVTCGHSHLISPKKAFNHLKQLSKIERRVRRSVISETKYVELFIINDFRQYQNYKEETEKRAKQLANHLDSLYRPQKIRIALVKIETWKDGDLFTVNRNATITLANFLKYKNQQLDKDNGEHWDNIQFVTNIDFLASTVGYASIGSICGAKSAAVIQDHSSIAAVTAATMAHELGHNFGMHHDATTCECPDKQKCIMAATLSPSSPATRFSTCSLNELRKTLNDGYAVCLFDEPNMLTGPSMCGNGFVEEGEQCDCGTSEECLEYENNNCCNSTTCLLNPGATCSHGECCDVSTCKVRPKGYSCREKLDKCDFAEYCTGDKELCPEDTYAHDGVSCNYNKDYCYSGVCRSHTLQCQYLFGEDVHAGEDICFGRNALNDHQFFGCFNKTHGHHVCNAKDVKCGKIHCLSDTKKYPIAGQDRNFYSVTVDGNRFCLVPGLTTGDGQDLEYVQDGTKCGIDMMCQNGMCLAISEIVRIPAWQSCPNNCSENGVCNNKGNCHCDSGYACPDCVGKGFGGSVDNGQGCEKGKDEGIVGGIDILAAVLIPLFIILLIIIIIIVYIKRHSIQDRLNRYKLVRRTASRSRTSTPKNDNGSRQLDTPRPKVSGPMTVSVDTPESTWNKAPTRRAAPDRPTVPVDNSGARRPPLIPSQLSQEPRSGHQSVPLFAPSAAAPQEPAARQRPPPPYPEPEYENLPSKQSTKLLPGKPKLPPSWPAHGHSEPDLASAPRGNEKPRPKPRAPRDGHKSVPEFPDDVPVPKQRNVAPRPGHQSVPLFNLPDGAAADQADNQSVKPSAVKARQPNKPTPSRKPGAPADDKPIDFRAGLKSVPKPWAKS